MKNNLNLFEVISLTITMFFFTSCSYAGKNEELNVMTSIKQSFENNSTVTTTINLSNNLSIPVIFDTTKKGNGSMKFNGLLIRVFDQHDDGVVFENDFLNVEVKDLNNDDIKELIFTGIIKHTGEKETDPAIYEPSSTIYQLNCATGFFVPIHRSQGYSIEVSNSQKNKLVCK